MLVRRVKLPRKHWTVEQIVEIVGVISLFGLLNRHTPVQAIVDFKSSGPIEYRDIQSIEIQVGPKELRPRHS